MDDDPLTPPAAIVDAAWREGRLVYQATADGRALWPPRLAAPGELTWRDSAGLGTVHAATALHTRDGDPRSIVLVDLDEGFRMMSRVEGPPAADVRIGMRVRMRFTEPAEDGARLPVFEPADEAST
jgi:uncharacterized OB-fold protein